MSHYQELTAIADDISATCLRSRPCGYARSPCACGSKSVGATTSWRPRAVAERLANSVAVEHLRLVRR